MTIDTNAPGFIMGDRVKVIGGSLTGEVTGYSVLASGRSDALVAHLDKDGFSIVETWIEHRFLERVA